MMLRRRFEALLRQALERASSLPDTSAAKYVVASRHGDYSRLMRLLEALAQDQALSPTDFSLSVHNALAGVLSIAKGNVVGHTAIAGGPETFLAGLTESLVCLAAEPQQPVILLFYDEPLPEIYRPVVTADATEPFVLGIAMNAAPEPPPRTQQPFRAASQEGNGLTESDVTQAQAFLRFLLTPDAVSETITGNRFGWQLSRG
jgi:hypothetical protein